MIHRCNAHIWCGHNISWVNALRMGTSECNLGLYLTKGAIDCYDQNEPGNRDICGGCTRGRFVLDIESIFLKSGEEYQLEWELFFHKSKEDFMSIISRYDNYIGIDAVHYTVFENENIDFTVKTSSGREPQIKWENEVIPFEKTENGFRVVFNAPHTGEYRFTIKDGDVSTWAEFAVKPPFRELLEKRVRFIIENQQCLDPESPLYGAFLVYDNDYDSMYFDYSNPDHNACRERMNIPLLLMKYLQMKDDADVRKAVDLYIKFMFREFYDRETGEVFNTIGKSRDQLRLYNAPGVMQILCEMYFVIRDESYLDDIIRLTETYYGIGGKKCYANGLTIGKIIRAFKLAGDDEKTEKMMGYFQTHVDNIIGNGTAYPKHEVNYEQTIVTPAVNYIAEMGALRENKEYYINEASKHIEILQRFSGMQPSFHLNEIAIRFWDDVWFGKNKMPGDTLPHHLSCLSARAYMSYGKLSGDNSWIAKSGKRQCRKHGVDGVFLIAANFGNEEAAGELAKKMGKPVLLWGPKDDAPEKADGMRYTDSQCGLFGISRQLMRMNVKYTYIENCLVSDDKLKNGLDSFARVACAIRNFIGMRVGEIGLRPRPFASVICNEGQLMEKFDIHFVPINLAVIQDKYNKILVDYADEIKEGGNRIRGMYKLDEASDETAEKQYAYYILFKQLFEEFDLDVISSECWSALQLLVGAMLCTVYGILADEGYIISCENDVHAAMTQVLLKSLTFGKKPPLFGEFTMRHPEQDNVELLWHCGQFAYSSRKEDGFCNCFNMRENFEAKNSHYTVARIDQDHGNDSVIAGECDSTEGPYTNGTYLWARFDDLDKWERKLVEGPYIHHVSEIEGGYTKEIKEFCKYVSDIRFDTV